MVRSDAPFGTALAAGLALAIVLGSGACGPGGDPGGEEGSEPGASAEVGAHGPPNVLLIVLDTTRADHLSYAGWHRPTTPHLDALARRATDYSNAHSTAPWTLPSHMSIFSGLLPGEHGATWATFDADMTPRHCVAWPERMLARRLREQGYRTLGISNNGWVSTTTGFDEGFDVFYEPWREDQKPTGKPARPPGATPAERQLYDGGAGRSLQVFEQHLRDEGLPSPFFVFVNLMDSHYPYLSPKAYASRWGADDEAYARMQDREARVPELAALAGAEALDYQALEPYYDGTIHYTDAIVGRLIAWLDEQGLFDETMIIVTSDHGEHLGEGGRVSHQLSVDETLLHVPLLIKHPRGWMAGEVVENPLVSSRDIYATVLAAAGVERLPGADDTLDLADMGSFDRLLHIAENYHSDSYLGVLLGHNPDFDADSQRIVRRAVFTPGTKFVFHDEQLVSQEALPGALPPGYPGKQRLESLVRIRLRAYVSRLERSPSLSSPGVARRADEMGDGMGPELPDGGHPLARDPELERALRELGYLGDG